jgi:hypothetical protein
MVDKAARRSYRWALAIFVVAVLAFFFEIVMMIGYAALASSTKDAIAEFGWGNVPPERLQPFIQASNAFGPIIVFCILVSGGGTMLLFYFAARSLRREGIKQYFGPALTAWSLLIPFYGFYRPWAGLGEVRNTLRQARREGRLPLAGIRGANAATVFYAIMVGLYSLASKIIELAADRLSNSDNINGAAAFNSYLDELAGLIGLDAGVSVILLIVVLVYWIATLRLIRKSLTLPPSAASTPVADSPVPATA